MNPRARVLALVLLAGCASAPQGTVVPSQRTSATTQGVNSAEGGTDVVTVTRRASIETSRYDAPIERTWTAVQAAYRQLGIPVTATELATFLLVTKNQKLRTIGGRPLGRFIDCPQTYDNLVGSGQVSVTVSTQLVPTGRDSVTELRTEVSASAFSTAGGGAITCTSNGRLQTLLQRTVAQQLDSAAVKK